MRRGEGQHQMREGWARALALSSLLKHPQSLSCSNWLSQGLVSPGELFVEKNNSFL